ncbi:MAG: glycosyltransferase family 4 protein [Ignavibacteria bacterium]|nr:glycosyltransferase family 4 protein [Ignavibacteria bacterium]
MLSLRMLGPYPPPYGGVALHLVRLMEACKQRGVLVTGLTLGGIPTALPDIRRLHLFDLFNRAPVHYHTDEGNFKWMILLSLWWRLFRIPFVVTVHSFRHRGEFSSPIVRRRLGRAYNSARKIIAVSTQVKLELQSRIGVSESLITVVKSALPISQWEKSAAMPDGIPHEWMAAPVRVLANAARLVRYEEKDLYGLDVAARAFGQIADPNVHCLIIIGDVIDVSLFDELSALVQDTSNIYLMNGVQEILAPIVNHAHIVLRPTRTEGSESLTLSEALELGKWAIGSDSVIRPKGTVLFRNEDPSDLARAVRECAVSVLQNQFPAPCIPNEDAADSIIDVVLEALSSDRR